MANQESNLMKLGIQAKLDGLNESAEKQDILIEIESQTSKYSAHIFSNPIVADHYRQVYEEKNYECKHLFDPELTWTSAEERKIIWKNDWHVCFWAFMMFVSLDIDRFNISSALSDNMLDDLGLTTNDFNLGNTLSLVCFLSAELPSQLISKWIGPDIWIPCQMILWSVVSMSQAAIKTKAGFLVTRSLIGALQGGFIPDICLWMSYFYTNKELPTRMSFFYIANPLSSIISSLLAFAILKIKTTSISQGWRWLFLVEGLTTFLVGIMSIFKMPASVAHTKAWYRKKGWYSEREEKILVNKVLRDDPQKGDMHNREPVSPKELIKALVDYNLWPIYFIRLFGDVASAPVNTYLTLTLRKLGFSTFKTNALTIPSNILLIITLIFTGWFSEKINQRALVCAVSPIWILSCLIPLRWWPGAQVNVWGTYALLLVMLGHVPITSISVSWASANANSVRTRAVSAALVNMFAQTAQIWAANIYRKDDAPKYKRGNTTLIIVAFVALGLCILTKFYYVYQNKQRDKIWNAMTQEERNEYIQNTTDDGNKRLDFRFSS